MNAGLAKLLEIMEADLSLPDKDLREALYKVNRNRGVMYGDIDFQGMGRKGLVIYRMEGLDKPTEYSWPQFVKMVRQAQKDDMKGDLAMTQSMEQKVTFDANAMALREIEVRIDQYAQEIVQNYLEIGRCICEAKDRKLVPHGQWEAWATAYTGMEIRTIQRLMKAAREVPAGSAMERLPLSKVMALLALPEPEQREALATEAADDSLTVKQLKDKIRQLTQEKDSQARSAQDLERKTARQDDMIVKLDADRAQMRTRISELEGCINNLIQAQAEAVNEEVAAQLKEKTAALRMELAEARAYAERQAELRQEAQQEMLNASMSAGGGMMGMRAFGPYELECAVRSFLGEAGVMAHMGAELSGMDESDRRDMRQCLNRVEDWLAAARKALDTVVIING